MKYPTGIHRYKIDGTEYFAEYTGRQKGFECCVCGKGCNAFTFNIYHADTLEELPFAINAMDYETWGYGADHLEQAVELIG